MKVKWRQYIRPTSSAVEVQMVSIHLRGKSQFILCINLVIYGPGIQQFPTLDTYIKLVKLKPSIFCSYTRISTSTHLLFQAAGKKKKKLGYCAVLSCSILVSVSFCCVYECIKMNLHIQPICTNKNTDCTCVTYPPT